MHEALQGLEPEIVWDYFDKIRQIPRCSKNEGKVVEFVMGAANLLGLKTKRDEAGNVVMIKPASKDYEDHPGICLQGHLDMVCEKNTDVKVDFAKDAIELRREGEYIMAKGTTLGSDNGIGCAILLALAKAKNIKHPPLELLFTVDEETGMTGASKMIGDFLTVRRLINVDSEELGTIYIGCAGGGDTSLRMPLGSKTEAEGVKGMELRVSGLKGGHSGVDIHLGRANAIKCLIRALTNIAKDQMLMLVDISGGNKRNAIPREAKAKVLVEDVMKAAAVAKAVEVQLKDQFEGIEDNIAIDHTEFKGIEGYSTTSSVRLIFLLSALPHGYLAFNPHIPELVDTSTNLATVEMEGDDILIGCNSRSSMNSAMEGVRDQIVACGMLAGAKCKKGDAYPSWKPNMKSELLAIAKSVYEAKYGFAPEIKAIHAGLETSIIGAHFGGMDM
ncbi:MAG: beta-Ala-His dipeptidase, partial [Thermoplasmata archaeon]